MKLYAFNFFNFVPNITIFKQYEMKLYLNNTLWNYTKYYTQFHFSRNSNMWRQELTLDDQTYQKSD